MDMTYRKNGDRVNGEPGSKKRRTEEVNVEIPKLILSKDGETFRSRLKFTSRDAVVNHYGKAAAVCSSYETGAEVDAGRSRAKKRHRRDKRRTAAAREDERPTTRNASSPPDRVVPCRRSGEERRSVTGRGGADGTESSSAYVSGGSPSVGLQLGIDQQTMQRFEELHEKYFDRSVRDTIVIVGNVAFMNLLTVMHCVSLMNRTLEAKDRRATAARDIRAQSALYVKYVQTLDDVLTDNCADVISIFGESDHEHALLMFVLCLYTGLKTFGSAVFDAGGVILKKLERLRWQEAATKHANFDHGRVLATLTSDTFRSSYRGLSTMIERGSGADPYVTKCWRLFYTPTVFGMTHFLSATEAIMNAADVDTVVRLIDDACNDVRLCSYVKHRNDPSPLNENTIDKLIALVGNNNNYCSTDGDVVRPVAGNDETAHDQTALVTPDQTENTPTPHYLRRPTSEASALNYMVGYTNSTKPTPSPGYVYLEDKTSTAIPATHECSHEQFENSTPITISKNTSKLHVDRTATLLTPKPNTLYVNFPIAHSTGISTIPFSPDFPQANRYQNTSTVVTDAAYASYKHKKFNSSCRVGNAQRFVNASPEYQQTRTSDGLKLSL